MSDITESVIGWIRQNCARGGQAIQVDPDTPLLAENLMDSLDFLNLVAFLEERYGIKIDSDALTPENFETPTTIVALVERSTET
ncbi:acyl carrier protein [Thioalkalivibrio paradoxus]|uniref:acyl carrier protein n=1 Tax=Thioalkalivibrio paradoxus TaxID=108010 RepID=UPI00022C3EB1|nr:acyl carrier protein [Thioalkalivibrio paradoxus]